MSSGRGGETERSASSAVRDALERVLREPPTMEHALLLLFLAVGTYMYLGADEFADAAALFPRVMAGTTIVLSAALLVRNYLPGPIRRVVAEPLQLAGEDELTGDLPDDEEPDEPEATDDADPAEPVADEETTESDSSATYSYDIDDPRGPAVVGVLCVGYMLLTFTVGMLYATPVFVAAYALWAGMETKRLVVLTIISFLTAYAFYSVISPDIAEGWLTGWELPVPGLLVAQSVGVVTEAVPFLGGGGL